MKIFRITFRMRGMEGYLRCKVQAPDSNLAINALLDKVRRKANPVGLGIGVDAMFEELDENTNKFRRLR
tara:strand:+ start:438 stop:644 length:207 start_codon:yes stop_codon:yes gene_type:complete